MSRNIPLRDFLRARRGALQPADVGLPAARHRRVPGLRREEVAGLAGVSVDYYTRLEQGRDLSPSDSMLNAVARALMLTEPQRVHLHTLVRPTAASDAAVSPQSVAPNVQRLLDWLDTPALVVGRGTAVLGGNPLAYALITDFSARRIEHRFWAHWLFLEPAARELLIDWDPYARETVGVVRADAARFPADARLVAIIEQLSTESDSFRTLWDEQEVFRPSSGHKRYHHPLVGELVIFHEVTQLLDDQWLYLYWAERGSTSEDGIDQLRAMLADGETHRNGRSVLA